MRKSSIVRQLTELHDQLKTISKLYEEKNSKNSKLDRCCNCVLKEKLYQNLTRQEENDTSLKLKNKKLQINLDEDENYQREDRVQSLEDELEKTKENLKYLQEKSQYEIEYLKNALKKSKNDFRSLSDSKDFLINEKDQMSNEISNLEEQIDNTTCECKNLKLLLDQVSKNEAKKCEEIIKEVNEMKSVFKLKEETLIFEKVQLKEMIDELTNMIETQKKRISELNDNGDRLKNSLAQKTEESYSLQRRLNSNDSENTCKCLKLQMDNLKKHHLYELNIKDRIIDDLDRIKKKQKKLLQKKQNTLDRKDCEITQLWDRFDCERRINRTKCNNCEILKAELKYVTHQEQRATTINRSLMRKQFQCQGEI